jgi:hypothetical protein
VPRLCRGSIPCVDCRQQRPAPLAGAGVFCPIIGSTRTGLRPPSRPHWRRDSAPTVVPRCGKRPLDLLLFADAVHLAWLAGRRWRGVPLSEAVQRLNRKRLLLPPGSVPVWRLRCAAVRASRYIGLAGGLDSCVTRALVLGSLLRGRDGVAICIGFRAQRDQTGSPEGHAWVCLDDVNVSDAGQAAVPGEFRESYRLALRERR